MFGNVYNPREAEQMGMVNRVLAPEKLCRSRWNGRARLPAGRERRAINAQSILARTATSNRIYTTDGDDAADVFGGRTNLMTVQ